MRSLSVFHGTRVFAWVKFGLCFLMLACAVGLFTIMVGLSMLASPVLAVADFVCFGWFFLLSACADQMECGTYLRYDALLYDRQI